MPRSATIANKGSNERATLEVALSFLPRAQVIPHGFDPTCVHVMVWGSGDGDRIESGSCGPAHVAQAVEHFLGKEKVPGSNPGVGSAQPSTVSRVKGHKPSAG